MCELHFFYEEIWKDLGEKDELDTSAFHEYLGPLEAGQSQPARDSTLWSIHEGHLVYMQPEERRFVTPEAIRAGCLTRAAEEIADRIPRQRKKPACARTCYGSNGS